MWLFLRFLNYCSLSKRGKTSQHPTSQLRLIWIKGEKWKLNQWQSEMLKNNDLKMIIKNKKTVHNITFQSLAIYLKIKLQSINLVDTFFHFVPENTVKHLWHKQSLSLLWNFQHLGHLNEDVFLIVMGLSKFSTRCTSATPKMSFNWLSNDFRKGWRLLSTPSSRIASILLPIKLRA